MIYIKQLRYKHEFIYILCIYISIIDLPIKKKTDVIESYMKKKIISYLLFMLHNNMKLFNTSLKLKMQLIY